MLEEFKRNFFYIVLAALLSYFMIKNDGQIRHVISMVKKDLFPESPEVNPDPDTVYLVPVGDVSSAKISLAQKTIKKHFGYPTKTLKKIEFNESMNIRGTKILDAGKCIHISKNPYKTMYLTRRNMLTSNDQTPVLGLALLGGNTSIVNTEIELESTIVHEIGHNLGLQHCENNSCVMSIGKDEYKGKYLLQFCGRCIRRAELISKVKSRNKLWTILS